MSRTTRRATRSWGRRRAGWELTAKVFSHFSIETPNRPRINSAFLRPGSSKSERRSISSAPGARPFGDGALAPSFAAAVEHAQILDLGEKTWIVDERLDLEGFLHRELL